MFKKINLNKIVNNLINYSSFLENKDYNFKEENSWTFKDGYVTKKDIGYKIVSLNIKDTPIAIIGLYDRKDKLLVNYIQGVDSRLRGKLFVPKDWYKVILEALIISSYKYIFNKKTKILNLHYNVNLKIEKIDLESLLKEFNELLSRKENYNILKIYDNINKLQKKIGSSDNKNDLKIHKDILSKNLNYFQNLLCLSKNRKIRLMYNAIIANQSKINNVNKIRDRYFDKAGRLNPNKKAVNVIISKYKKIMLSMKKPILKKISFHFKKLSFKKKKFVFHLK